MGSFFSLIDQSYPPKSRFTAEDVPDMTGKVVIVTGANTGIGKETARAVLAKNAKVYVAARSQAKAEEAIKDLKASTGKESVAFLQLDLSDLKSIKKSAEDFASKETELHVLFNNAGVMIPPIDSLTKDGYDLTFGTNVLGHFYFTKLLLPILISTAKHSKEGKVRVVNTSSSAELFSPQEMVKYDTLRDTPERRKFGVNMLYTQSKSGNILFSNELAKRYADQGIVSTALNPGNIKTDLQRHVSAKAILDLFLKPVQYGAITQLYAGTSPEGADLNGKYLVPWARVKPASAKHANPELAEKLWDWLEEQVKDL